MTDKNEFIPFEEVERGKYVSLLADHPGYVKFPAPLQGRHYKAWEQSKSESDELELDVIWKDWRAALAVMEEWAIEGVPQTDVKPEAENVPLEVIHWLRLVSIKYFLDAVTLKNLAAPSATT